MAGNRSRRNHSTQSCVINDEASSDDSFHEFEEITQLTTTSSTQSQLGNSRRRPTSSFIPYIHYIYESKLDQYQRSFSDQLDLAIEDIIQSCESLSEIGQFTTIESEIDSKLLDVLAKKIESEQTFVKIREVLNLIDHTGDLNALDKLWTMNDGFVKETSGSGERASKKVKDTNKLMIKKMPKKFSQYKARIWDITNPYDSMPISYAQTPVDNWIGKWKKKELQSGSNEKSQSDGSDEDIEEEDVVFADTRALPIKCPISLQLFVDPVKNRQCGHVYSRLSIDQYISSAGGRTTCPVVGCSSIVTKESIVPDMEVQAKLDRIALMKLFEEQKDLKNSVTLTE